MTSFYRDQILTCPLEIYVGIGDKDWNGTPLAYVTYKKENGEVAKSTSFEDWCSDTERKTFKNEPTEGFKVLANIGGGGRYDSRRAWFRIQDPRGFKFEITADNFMEILSKHTIEKGVVKGKFAYGWDGSELLLCSSDSARWKNGIKSAECAVSDEKVSKDNIVVGHGYCLRNVDNAYYIGRFKWYSYNHLPRFDTPTTEAYTLEATNMYTFIGKRSNGEMALFGYKEIKNVKFDTGKVIDETTVQAAIKEFNNSIVSKPISNLTFKLKTKCIDKWKRPEDRDKENESYESWCKSPMVEKRNRHYESREFKILGDNRLDIIISYKFKTGNILNFNLRSFYLTDKAIIEDTYIEPSGVYGPYSYESHLNARHEPWAGDKSLLTPMHGESCIYIQKCSTKVGNEIIPAPINRSKTYETVSTNRKDWKF